jgi:hypothetical protein
MLCMSCGEKMRLVKVDQEECGLIPGFAHHTFECTSCRDVERRLMLAGATMPEPVSSIGPNEAAPSHSLPLPELDQVAQHPASAARADRAVPSPAPASEPDLAAVTAPSAAPNCDPNQADRPGARASQSDEPDEIAPPQPLTTPQASQAAAAASSALDRAATALPHAVSATAMAEPAARRWLSAIAKLRRWQKEDS